MVAGSNQPHLEQCERGLRVIDVASPPRRRLTLTLLSRRRFGALQHVERRLERNALRDEEARNPCGGGREGMTFVSETKE